VVEVGKKDKHEKRVSSYYIEKSVAYYRYHRYSMWRKRKRKPEFDKIVIKMSEEAYKMRKKEGITKNNTRFLEK